MARKRTRAESSSIKIYLTFSSLSSPGQTSRTGERPGPGPGRDSSFIISPMLSPPRLACRSGAVRGSYARQTTIAHRGKSRAPGDDFFFTLSVEICIRVRAETWRNGKLFHCPSSGCCSGASSLGLFGWQERGSSILFFALRYTHLTAFCELWTLELDFVEVR